MTAAAWMQTAWTATAARPRARRAALIAASVGFHALVLGWLALRTYSLPAWVEHDDFRPVLPPAPIDITLERWPSLARAPVTPPLDAADRPTRRAVQPISPAPTLPQPRQAAAPPADAPPPPDYGPWTVRPQTPGAARPGPTANAMTCRAPSLLPRDQQAVCEQRWADAAGRQAPISGTGDARRDAAMAAAAADALARYEYQRRPLSGGIGVVGPQDGVGSNFGMGVAGAHMDPSLRPDSTENIRTNQRDGRR